MPRAHARPLSPHLTIWKWGPHMLVSILHRATGNAMATAGVIALVWWLVAAATGPEAYATFQSVATSWVGVVVGIGLSWAFFEHLLSGIRHLVLDTGAGYELKTNRRWAALVPVGSIALTVLLWAFILLGHN